MNNNINKKSDKKIEIKINIILIIFIYDLNYI